MAFMICTVNNEKKKKEALYSKDLNKVIIARPWKLNVISKICKKRHSMNDDTKLDVKSVLLKLLLPNNHTSLKQYIY